MGLRVIQRNWLAATLVLGLLGIPGFKDAIAAPAVDATIEPAEISLGESAQLTITASGSTLPQIAMPSVSGLNFRLAGQSRRIEMINGVTIATTSFVIQVTPQAAGTYTIPGLTPKSQPLILRVSSGQGSSNSSPNNRASSMQSTPSTPSPAPSRSSEGGIHLTPDGSAFVRLGLPKHEVYVGESVPVDIEVGMRDGFVASLNGLPTLSGGEFTLNNLSHQPERVPRIIDGKPFTILTWHSILAPVKPGTFSLSMETPLTVRIPTRPRRESMLDDLLGDPFLQNIFGATVTKDINVTSPTTEFTVLPLPSAGRPADFTGAVGTFKMTAELPSKSVAGDPMTLRMHVTGTGNFDRVESTMLDGVDQWKTYQPKSTFTPADSTGYRGEKVFEQPLIAIQPGEQTLPPLAFSFFNPATRHYETLHSSPLTVSVAAPAGAAAANVAASSGSGTKPPHDPNNGRRPDHAVSDGLVASLTPLYLQPRFLAISSALALLFAGAWFVQHRRALGIARPGLREKAMSKALQASFQEMQAASNAKDPLRFFNAARTALTQALALRWHVPPEQITAADIDTRLGEDADSVRQIFTFADEANFSGDALKVSDFERWTQVVRRQLTSKPA